MKILFVMRHPAAVRLLGSVLRLLDDRGHEVHLAFRRIKTGESHRELQRLAEECAGLTFGRLPTRGSPGWDERAAPWIALAEQLRHDADFLRYLEPRYASAPELRARAEVKARPSVRLAGRAARVAGPAGVRALRRSLELAERCLPPPPHVERFVADLAPDVLLVTHLAEFGSGQTDYVRAAKRLGIHTGYPVFSWDNLTNKGLVHDLPEQVIVWNDLQAAEAVELQGIPRGRVTVTGSSAYDHWFEWAPSRTREQLCAEVGLRADRPILLYTCSSPFVAPKEVAFVRRWIRALRERGGPLGEAGVIVRLHPRNLAQWVDVSLDEPQAAIWPRFGEEPLDEASRRNYFDSIYHSAAVVGINTSAQIESAIVGRPVHTVLAEEFRDTQQGTLHFHYLKADGFGHLHVGRTMAEHLDQLEESLRGRPGDAERNERFLRRFVRPFGLDVPATPRFVEAVEELVSGPAARRDRGPATAPAVRLALRPLAALAGRRDRRDRATREVTPLDELRRTVRRLGRESPGPPIVAGPWLEDEIGELLYWIPFLRWAQVATFDLRERLVVAAREGSAGWYEGIGSQLVVAGPGAPVEQALGTDELRRLPASLVAERRAHLARRHPGEGFLHRFLDFAPLPAPEPPAGADVPQGAVAVCFEPGDPHAAAVAAALAARGPVVEVDPAGPGPRRTALIAAAGGLVCRYGPEAYLAALLGVPAVALDGETAAEDDLRLAAAFLGEPPFGRLRVVPAADGVDAAAALLDETVPLAGVR
jgi:hypothetical protein